jgi:hypothetical protein
MLLTFLQPGIYQIRVYVRHSTHPDTRGHLHIIMHLLRGRYGITSLATRGTFRLCAGQLAITATQSTLFVSTEGLSTRKEMVWSTRNLKQIILAIFMLDFLFRLLLYV